MGLIKVQGLVKNITVYIIYGCEKIANLFSSQAQGNNDEFYPKEVSCELRDPTSKSQACCSLQPNPSPVPSDEHFMGL